MNYSETSRLLRTKTLKRVQVSTLISSTATRTCTKINNRLEFIVENFSNFSNFLRKNTKKCSTLRGQMSAQIQQLLLQAGFVRYILVVHMKLSLMSFTDTEIHL